MFLSDLQLLSSRLWWFWTLSCVYWGSYMLLYFYSNCLTWQDVPDVHMSLCSTHLAYRCFVLCLGAAALPLLFTASVIQVSAGGSTVSIIAFTLNRVLPQERQTQVPTTWLWTDLGPYNSSSDKNAHTQTHTHAVRTHSFGDGRPSALPLLSCYTHQPLWARCLLTAPRALRSSSVRLRKMEVLFEILNHV